MSDEGLADTYVFTPGSPSGLIEIDDGYEAVALVRGLSPSRLGFTGPCHVSVEMAAMVGDGTGDWPRAIALVLSEDVADWEAWSAAQVNGMLAQLADAVGWHGSRLQ